jgi:hypothetical protein
VAVLDQPPDRVGKGHPEVAWDNTQLLTRRGVVAPVGAPAEIRALELHRDVDRCGVLDQLDRAGDGQQHPSRHGDGRQPPAGHRREPRHEIGEAHEGAAGQLAAGSAAGRKDCGMHLGHIAHIDDRKPA